MNPLDDTSGSVREFSGRAPLFPLPNAAFLPYVILPLHIFEPRYRKMAADALEGDQLIAMAQMKPGWETLRESEAPEIHSTVCLGRIVSWERLDDGRYYLLLQGLSRARVVGEEQNDLPYRVGQLELVEDAYASDSLIDRESRRSELLAGFRSLYPDVNLEKFFGELDETTVPLGMLCDILGYALRLPPADIQQILGETDVDARSELVLHQIKAAAREESKPPTDFPPKFSEN